MDRNSTKSFHGFHHEKYLVDVLVEGILVAYPPKQEFLVVIPPIFRGSFFRSGGAWAAMYQSIERAYAFFESHISSKNATRVAKVS